MLLEELDMKEWKKTSKLFESHILYRSIIHPCMQTGRGSVTTDSVDSPSVAKYSIPMMIFLAGDATDSAALELTRSLPPLTIFIVPDKNWSQLLKNEWGKRLVGNKRTHLDHSTLNISRLRELKKRYPAGYTLKQLDFEVLPQIDQEYKIPIQMYFGSLENLIRAGFGFCLQDDNGKLVSYAYTAFPFLDEFEIQVVTENSPEYRRKGLATVVSAALIIYGLERDFVPHWDAANEASAKLALKLGYSSPITWEAYYYTPE
jgi:hypothetical protein